MFLRGRIDYKRLFHIGLLSCVICVFANAQDQPSGPQDLNQTATPTSTAAQPAVDPPSDWHVNLNVYLWFPGIHGIIGKNDFNIGYKASATDLISHLRIGFMGMVGAQHGRFVTLADLVWVRLRDSTHHTFALPTMPQLSSQEKFYFVIFTPEFGYRMLDGEKFKIDVLGGARLWHLQSTVNFDPSFGVINLSRTANFADPLMGARFQMPLSSRLLATIWGDAGGWGAGSQLDYQIVGALAFRLGEKWALDGGYRYLYLNYLAGTNKFQMAQSGALLGVTYTLK